MRMAVKTLRWTTIGIWIFIALAVSTVLYSAARTEIGDPQYEEIHQGSLITVRISMDITNNGLYDVSNVSLQIRLLEPDGDVVASDNCSIPVIHRGESYALNSTVYVDKRDLDPGVEALTAITTVTMKYAGLIAVQIHVNSTVAVD